METLKRYTRYIPYVSHSVHFPDFTEFDNQIHVTVGNINNIRNYVWTFLGLDAQRNSGGLIDFKNT